MLGTALHYTQVVQQTALSSLICTSSFRWHTKPSREITFPSHLGVGEVSKEMFPQASLIKTDIVFFALYKNNIIIQI